MPSARDELNSRQQQFCIEYAKGKSGAQAYLDAGYDPKDRQNASRSAHRLLKKDKIEREWKRIMNARKARTDARKSTAVAEALGFALGEFSDTRDIMTKIKEGEELTEEQKMYFSKVMNIISSLSRENIINIEQSQNQAQGQGQSGLTVKELHEMAEDYDTDADDEG